MENGKEELTTTILDFVELRAFSCGCILISRLRNRLRAETICAVMCFGDWSHQDYISNEELVRFLLSDANNDGEDIELIDDDDIL